MTVRYLDIDELERTQLDIFDNWVRTFANPEQLFEIDVNASRYRMVRKFARFCNLPELSAMFSRIAIFHAADKEGLPEVEERKDIVIKRSPELAEYMASLCVRSEKIRSGHINPRYDNMLKVSTDGRKAALDLTLVGRTQPRGDFCKIDSMTRTLRTGRLCRFRRSGASRSRTMSFIAGKGARRHKGTGGPT